VTVVGRVCCDSNGKLNASSLLLEGGSDTSGGRQVALDVSSVQVYSLFPGQVCFVFSHLVDSFDFVKRLVFNTVSFIIIIYYFNIVNQFFFKWPILNKLSNSDWKEMLC
jgi:hypothetical protein